jgi:hypothetical protein
LILRQVKSQQPTDTTNQLLTEEDFLYFKVGCGNFLAHYWISEENVRGKKAIAAYFGPITSKKILDFWKKYKKSGDDRVKFLKNHSTDEVYPEIIGANAMDKWKQFFILLDGIEAHSWFVTIFQQNFHVYKLEGTMSDLKPEEYEHHNKTIHDLVDNPKTKAQKAAAEKRRTYLAGEEHGIPKIVYLDSNEENYHEKPITELPLNLQGLNRDLEINQKTCAIIANEGIRFSIRTSILGQSIPISDVPSEMLGLLSPIEFETLISHVLSAEGLYVPAWRGGSRPVIDLEAYNDDEKNPVRIKGFPEIPPNSHVTFQIKKKIFSNESAIQNLKKNLPADHFIIVLEGKGDNVIDADHIMMAVESQESTLKWLKRAIRGYSPPNI